MLSSLLLLGLRSLFVAASSPEEEDDGVVEDELPPRSPFPDGKMPSPDELLKMLDSMTGLTDEDKEALRRDLMLKAGQGAGLEDEFAGAGEQHIAASSFFASQFFVLLVMLTIISLIFVFFGYKLYKSLSERERKREEKKKMKQLKKKK